MMTTLMAGSAAGAKPIVYLDEGCTCEEPVLPARVWFDRGFEGVKRCAALDPG